VDETAETSPDFFERVSALHLNHMEVIMLKEKHTKIMGLFILGALMILPVILAACQTTADSAAAPIGLRSTETETVVESGVAGLGVVAGLTNDGLVNPLLADSQVSESTETGSSTTTTGTIGNEAQTRLADRSQHIIDPNTTAPLSTAEIEGLAYMREEEKLARDVYLALYEQWGLPIFQNIAGSEQAHMDSVLLLLDQYGLADPAAGLDTGEFSQPFFQSLYAQLVAQGRLSSADALIVGANIEELDIVDLQARAAQTSNEYINQVYANLLAGSENHLRAFVSNLERQTGEVYQPVYLDQVTYQTIISAAGERGNGYGRGGNGNNGAGGGGNGRQNGRGGSA
jgi:hypothetical protein